MPLKNLVFNRKPPELSQEVVTASAWGICNPVEGLSFTITPRKGRSMLPNRRGARRDQALQADPMRWSASASSAIVWISCAKAKPSPACAEIPRIDPGGK